MADQYSQPDAPEPEAFDDINDVHRLSDMPSTFEGGGCALITFYLPGVPADGYNGGIKMTIRRKNDLEALDAAIALQGYAVSRYGLLLSPPLASHPGTGQANSTEVPANKPTAPAGNQGVWEKVTGMKHMVTGTGFHMMFVQTDLHLKGAACFMPRGKPKGNEWPSGFDLMTLTPGVVYQPFPDQNVAYVRTVSDAKGDKVVEWGNGK